eukprot:gene16609-biopygen12825
MPTSGTCCIFPRAPVRPRKSNSFCKMQEDAATGKLKDAATGKLKDAARCSNWCFWGVGGQAARSARPAHRRPKSTCSLPPQFPPTTPQLAPTQPPALSRTGEKAAKSVKERTVVYVEVPNLRSAPGA